MKNVLIIEHNPNPLQSLKESVNASQSIEDNKYLLGGTFTEFDVKNRNERIYTWSKFQPAFEEFTQRLGEFGVYGELDHPDVFDTSLKNSSHMVKEASFHKDGNKITGKIQLLSTSNGREARSLVNDGYPLFVSSRAAGITEADGTVTLKKLFTYDIVADPGFASARMGSINESIGYSTDDLFQIYEMSDESKINKLFEMNKEDIVTKKHLSEYSEYLVGHIATIKNQVTESLKKGNLNPKKLEELLEYYSSIQEDQEKVGKYLDYLAEKVQVVVNENKDLKETTGKLIKHNDYLAENLEKSIGYSNYLAENLDKNIQYGEYVAEQLDKTIDYSKYIAENLDKNIEFSDYIAENLNKTIEFSDYIAENLDTNIAYAEYIAEHLDDGLAYTDYIAEQVDKSVNYSKMISEKLNATNSKLNENWNEEEDSFPSPDAVGFETIEDEDEVPAEDGLESPEGMEDVDAIEAGEDEEGSNCRVVCDDDDTESEEDLGDDNPELDETPEIDTEVVSDEELEEEDEERELAEVAFESKESDETNEENKEEVVVESSEESSEETTEEVNEEATEEVDESNEESKEVKAEKEDEDCKEEDCNEEDPEMTLEESASVNEEKSSITDSIDMLILEAKKRKASETTQHHFLKFLNKNQVDAFYKMTPSDQESVVSHIDEKKQYFGASDVLTLINEALSSKEETAEDKLVRLMPEEIKDSWTKLSESAKISMLSQARLHPDLASWNDDQVEHFWLTRRFPVINESGRQLIASEDKLITEDVLSEDAFNSIMERFKKI